MAVDVSMFNGHVKVLKEMKESGVKFRRIYLMRVMPAKGRAQNCEDCLVDGADVV